MDQAVVEQPRSVDPFSVPGESGPVIVKPMTKNDMEFASAMAIEAFRDKMATAVGESKYVRYYTYRNIT